MAALVCPKCEFNNPHGTLYCQKCFAILIDSVGMQKTETFSRKTMVTMVDSGQLRRKRIAESRIILKAHAIALYVDLEQTPLILLLTKQAILGRGLPNDGQMRVDLTPYKADDKGVSRQHIILKRAEAATLVVEDMGSSNGTWLNGTLLQPYRAAPVASGDKLRLAKLTIAVFLP